MFPYFVFNGRLQSTSEPAINISDVGLLRGYGIFDFFPIVDGAAVFEAQYFERFFRSARALNLEVPVTPTELAAHIMQLTDKNGERDGYLKLVLTGGDSPNGYTPGASNLLLIQHSDISYPESYFTQGISLLLQKYLRPAPEVKSLNYANAIRHRDLLDAHAAIDILYHDGRMVHETSRANFFIVDRKGALRTSEDTLLLGITRRQVLDLAAELMPVHIGPLSLAEVSRAQEAFITSTTKNVMPVTKINGWMLSRGEAGPRTKGLMELYQAHLQRHKLGQRTTYT